MAGGLALPAAATTASLTLDRPCYVAGQSGTLRLSGFTPGAAVAVTSSELGDTTVTADAAGGAAVAITPAAGDEPAAREIGFTATQAGDQVATAQLRALVAPRAFATATGTSSPKQPRTWRFSGWTPERPLYAHFRLDGRTRGGHRFGVAAGPCGELTARTSDRRARGDRARSVEDPGRPLPHLLAGNAARRRRRDGRVPDVPLGKEQPALRRSGSRRRRRRAPRSPRR